MSLCTIRMHDVENLTLAYRCNENNDCTAINPLCVALQV
jgi:hypothetical protein